MLKIQGPHRGSAPGSHRVRWGLPPGLPSPNPPQTPHLDLALFIYVKYWYECVGTIWQSPRSSLKREVFKK